MADPLSVSCPDCAVPARTPCAFSTSYLAGDDDAPRVHAERQRVADLRALEHGTCALCRQPMVRGTVEDRPLDAWHHDAADAAVCPRIPDPRVDMTGWATAVNLGLEPGHPGLEHFRPASDEVEKRQEVHHPTCAIHYSEDVVSCTCRLDRVLGADGTPGTVQEHLDQHRADRAAPADPHTRTEENPAP